MTTTIFQLIVTAVYLLFIVSEFGVLPSISDSFYRLQAVRTWAAPLFTLWTWLVAIPFTQTGNDWLLASGTCLILVGVLPFFKWDGFVGYAHSAMAISAIALALAGEAIQGVWWPSILAVGASILLQRLNVKNQTWWVEISCFVSIMVGRL